MSEKRALITGVTGQDGAYLAEVLLEKGYEVHGVKRRSSSFNTGRIDHLYQDLHQDGVKFKMHYGDMTDATNLIRLVQTVQPTEISIAAQVTCMRNARVYSMQMRSEPQDSKRFAYWG